MIAFGAATVAEIIAYYIPWVDNALDSVAVPLATIAGIFVTGSIVADLDPVWRWTLAIIAGGGAAASTQLATTKVRAVSSSPKALIAKANILATRSVRSLSAGVKKPCHWGLRPISSRRSNESNTKLINSTR